MFGRQWPSDEADDGHCHAEVGGWGIRRVLSVAYFITRPDVGGAQTHLLSLLRAGQGQREQHLVTGLEGPLTRTARQVGVSVHLLPCLGNQVHLMRDFAAVQGAQRLLEVIRPDLVHAHSSKAGLIGRLAAHRAGIPAVFTAHGWAFSEGAPAGRRALAVLSECLASRWSSRIICVSRYDQDLALRYKVAPLERLRVIHNGVPDVDDDLRARPANGTPVRVTMVARFEPPKDHAGAIAALGRVVGPCELCFVGEGALELRARRLTARLGLGQRVRFLGNRDDVSRVLAQSHVFALVSDFEGLPISVIEGMRAGLPIVATSVGGIPELVEHGTNGLLVPRGDTAALARAWQALVHDPTLRMRLGDSSLKVYHSGFTEDRMVKETEAVYTEVLTKTPGAHGGVAV